MPKILNTSDAPWVKRLICLQLVMIKGMVAFLLNKTLTYLESK